MKVPAPAFRSSSVGGGTKAKEGYLPCDLACAPRLPLTG